MQVPTDRTVPAMKTSADRLPPKCPKQEFPALQLYPCGPSTLRRVSARSICTEAAVLPTISTRLDPSASPPVAHSTSSINCWMCFVNLRFFLKFEFALFDLISELMKYELSRWNRWAKVHIGKCIGFQWISLWHVESFTTAHFHG